MKFRFFIVPAQYPEDGEEALNAFCSGHKVTAVEKQFVALGADSFWSVRVTPLTVTK